MSAALPSNSSSVSLDTVDTLIPDLAVGIRGSTDPSASEDGPSRSMRVALQLQARSLPNLDRRGVSDPFVVLYRRSEPSNQITPAANTRTGADAAETIPVVVAKSASANPSPDEWLVVGHTETVYNNLNPSWARTFQLDYNFGSNTALRFVVYDRDKKGDDLTLQDFIGEVKCTVAQVILAEGQRLEMLISNPTLPPGARTGMLIVRGEELRGDLGENVTLVFSASNLRYPRKPFYILSSRNVSDEGFSPVFYSEVHDSVARTGQSATFNPLVKSLSRLVNGELGRELRVEFFSYDRKGAHRRGGAATFTLSAVRSMLEERRVASFPLQKVRSKGGVVAAGTVAVTMCDISAPYSFLDYLKGGVVINTVIAIDMSNTNGNPRDVNSLHYMSRQQPNEYVIALREVGNVLAAYTTSNMFPAYGFGATLAPNYEETSHCFALTGNFEQPLCVGIDSVVDMYYAALSNVAPFSPCYYGPVLEHVIEMTKAENERDAQTVYTIFLLITDGDFNDFGRVADLICGAAHLPLSIVIVGVGNSHFVQLEKLDGDDLRLCDTNGTPCARDIVQFVKFHEHRYDPKRLAREVLDEIPFQLVSYMRSKSIRPSDVVPSGAAQRYPESPRLKPGPYIPESVRPQLSQTTTDASLLRADSLSTQTMAGVGPQSPLGGPAVPPPISPMSSRPSMGPGLPPNTPVRIPSAISQPAPSMMHNPSRPLPPGVQPPGVPPTYGPQDLYGSTSSNAQYNPYVGSYMHHHPHGPPPPQRVPYPPNMPPPMQSPAPAPQPSYNAPYTPQVMPQNSMPYPPHPQHNDVQQPNQQPNMQPRPSWYGQSPRQSSSRK